MRRSVRLALLVSLLTAAPLAFTQSPPVVLGLFKSSEGQTAADNEIVYHVEPALRTLGLAVRYHDLDTGLPPEALVNGVRAVVSWFRGPALERPLEYLEFIRKTVDGGRRYLVLDNLGAYQDRATGRWLESGELNLTLSRFGIQYWGDWTDEAAKVVLRTVDPAVVRRAVLEGAGARLYYRYVASDRDLSVHLSVERTDRADGPSPVVVTNRNGGFVLSTWLYRAAGGGTALALEFPELLRRALYGVPRADRVAVVTDTTGDTVAALALRLARGAKLGADLRTDAGSLVKGELDPYTTVVLSLGRPDSLPDAVIGDYLARGGSVVALTPALPPSVRSVAATGTEAPTADVKGFRFGAGFLPSEGFFLEDRGFEWVSGTLRPASGATVIASDWTEETPLLWSRFTAAGGSVLVWNTTGFFREVHAGLLLESILASRPVSAAVVPALAVVRMDGLPRPLYNANIPAQKSTDTELYANRVWPELAQMLAKRAVPVSGSLLFNYNDRTSPPFLGGELYMANGQATVAMARQIAAGPGELGLFGYNHISLATVIAGANTRAWPGEREMRLALESVRAEWSLLFGSPPRSYAAPYGVLSEAGLSALHAVFPSVVVAGTLATSGGLSERGFSRDPTTGVRIVPAFSTGFLYTEEARRLSMSGVAGEGVWVHAVDADDVLDPRLKGWDEQKADLDRLLTFVARHYPWLRYVRASDLAAELDAFESIPARLAYTTGTAGGGTYVIETAPGVTVRLRYPGLKVSAVQGADVVHTYTRADAAVLRSREGKVTVSLVRKV